MNTRVLALATCVVGFGLIATNARPDSSASTEAATFKQMLEDHLDRCYGPIWAKRDPAEFVRECLAEDVVITSADATTVWKGRQQNISLIQDLMNAYPQITATGVWTARVGPDAGLQFVLFQLTPVAKDAPPAVAKSLYVWVRTPEGWRIIADHYSFVGMDIPK